MVAVTAERYVLVVEDDAPLRELYRSMLRGAGYRVIAVDDGLAALRAIDSNPPAAVVLDLGLPRLSGRDVQRELRGRPETRHIPIVVVTGNDASDLNPEDFACIVRKPITVTALLTAVEDSLRRNRYR